MKSMTDFIMEQEAPQVVEESFNENELISNFMGVCAASANLTCVLECANIVEFCNANDIAVPSIIQEGWADFWTGIKNFFKKIADWFRSLVKGTVATFEKSNLQKLIAKLKTFDQDEEIDTDLVKLTATWELSIGLLETFRVKICEKIMDKHADMKKDDGGDDQALYEALEEAKRTTAGIKDISKWFASSGKVKDDTLFDAVKNCVDEAGSKVFADRAAFDKQMTDKHTIRDLLVTLEAMNKANIPSQGEKILKQFEVTVEKIDASFTHEENAGTRNNPNMQKKVDRSAAEIQKIVKEAADAIAKFYDKVKSNMIKISDLAYKDTEVAADKKKDYEKELSNANKDANRDDLRKGSNVIR